VQCDGEIGQWAECEIYFLPACDTVQFVMHATILHSDVNMSTKIRHMTQDSPVRRLSVTLIQKVTNPFIFKISVFTLTVPDCFNIYTVDNSAWQHTYSDI